jgi:UrcA family protein
MIRYPGQEFMDIQTAHRRRYGIFILGCAMLALFVANPGFALGGTMGPDVTVRFHDLDLDTASGANKLLKRIRRAAASVCEPLYKGTPASKFKRDQCVLQLTAETVAKVNRPTLLAAHASSLRKTRSKAVMPG